MNRNARQTDTSMRHHSLNENGSEERCMIQYFVDPSVSHWDCRTQNTNTLYQLLLDKIGLGIHADVSSRDMFSHTFMASTSPQQADTIPSQQQLLEIVEKFRPTPLSNVASVH